jgi:hypothetical protein
MGKEFADENYLSTFEGYEESFGFTKLRMWDQYADKFSGVCIALSKKKILSKNRKRLEIFKGNVRYLSFQKLLIKKPGDIQGNHLLKVGKQKYREQLKGLIEKSFFYKHVDYLGETEYRIGTLFSKEKCSAEISRGEVINDKSMMLDISECIKAIFVSSFANEKQKKDLLEIAIKLDVEIIEMVWQYNSFRPINYKKWTEFPEECKKGNQG